MAMAPFLWVCFQFFNLDYGEAGMFTLYQLLFGNNADFRVNKSLEFVE